ncbi:MAG TPA: Mth938-like domain-containing protein [Allosphingosinicella sp.]|jgi:uncharacterized protein
MARLTPDEPAPGPIVQGFSGTGFSVDGRVYPAVLLTPDSASSWSPPATASGLILDQLQPLLALERPPEFLLLGTGPALAFPPRPLVRALEAQGIGVEAMDSRAAARTWGLLRGEGRWIAAALMPLA